MDGDVRTRVGFFTSGYMLNICLFSSMVKVGVSNLTEIHFSDIKSPSKLTLNKFPGTNISPTFVSNPTFIIVYTICNLNYCSILKLNVPTKHR